MSKIQCRKWGLPAAVVTFLSVTVCGISLQMVNSWRSWSPGEYAVEQTKSLLEAVQTQPLPQELTLDDFPNNEWLSRERCISLVEQGMARNNNEFELVVVGIYGDYGTPIPSNTGSDEVLVGVEFPDGTVLELSYYNSTFIMCQKQINSAT